MGGMELMLKSFGLDPKAIQKQVGEFGQIVVALKAQMDSIETKLDAVLADNAIRVEQMDKDNSNG
jgi:hypothetical protein